jgi:hypothetical protein
MNLSMTPEHVIFIPAILIVGMTIGYVMGTRAARKEITRKRAKLKE